MQTLGHALAQRLNEAVEAGEIALWDLRPEQETVQYSPAWKQRLGFPEPEGADSTHFWRCRVHPDDLGGMLTAIRAHIGGTLPAYEAIFRLRSNGSGYRLLHSRGRVIERAADGRATRLVGAALDLTPRPCTPRTGLPAGPRGAMAGLPLALPVHQLLCGPQPDPAMDAAAAAALAAERQRVLGLMDDLLRATLAQLDEQHQR